MIMLAHRPETSDLWQRLSTEERTVVNFWLDVIVRFEAAPDKMLAIAEIQARNPGRKGLSSSAIYARVSAYRSDGLEGIIPIRAMRKLGIADGGLPTEFVNWWQTLCVQNQRGKIAAAYRSLIIDHLMAGEVIAGYSADWRGIYAAEHPHAPLPRTCPYRVSGLVPHGWSYRNLVALRPSEDVMAACTMGVGAGRMLLPSIPHTRAGLPFGSLFVVDDIQHDNKVNFLGQQQAERPLELGMMECLTGRFVSWGVVPTRRNEDGTREMIKESYMRYLLCDLLCRVGIHPDGCTILAEHGTAAIRGALLEQINSLIGGRLRVSTSSVLGEPLVAGLFAERPRGNPKFKAMLESTWNLLHNELAALPGQVGKDRDHSPQDITGRDRENGQLVKIAQELPERYAAALIMPYVNYHDFVKALTLVKQRIEMRSDHNLEGWEACGFTRQVVVHQDGHEVCLDDLRKKLPSDKFAAFMANAEILGADVRCQRLSPLEAWRKCERDTRLVRYPLSVAAVVLGPTLGKVIEVKRDGTLEMTNEFTRERISYAAMAESDSGIAIPLVRGTKYLVHINPFDRTRALISTDDGRWIGVAKGFVATTHGDTEAVKENLGTLSTVRAEHSRQVARVLDPVVRARREAVEHNLSVIAEAELSERNDPSVTAVWAEEETTRIEQFFSQD